MKAVTALFIVLPCLAAGPDVNEIMGRVAENYDRLQATSTAWVFDQNVFVRLKKSNGKPAREETRNYVVAPTEKGAGRKLVDVAGKISDGKNEITYNVPAYRTKDTDIDGAIVDALARDVDWRKDEIGQMAFLFPLDGKHQSRYRFKLAGEEKYQEFDAWRITFEQTDDDWQGELLVEKKEFHPLELTAHWDSRIPRAVSMLLGTSVKQVGTKMTWQRMADGVWFPSAAGGEMKLRVLFLYARTIAWRSVSSGFRRTDVQSSVEYEPLQPAAGPLYTTAQ